MADTIGYGLVIYDSDSDKIWRLESGIFLPDPTFANYTIGGESFQLQNGILGMAKHPYAPVLYFRPMSSRNINSARTTDLKKSRYGAKVHYYTIRDVFPSQATAMAISSNGVLFFGLPTELSVACWNTCKPFNKNNLVSQSDLSKILSEIDLYIHADPKLKYDSRISSALVASMINEHIIILNF